jgi:uncharacterized protein
MRRPGRALLALLKALAVVALVAAVVGTAGYYEYRAASRVDRAGNTQLMEAVRARSAGRVKYLIGIGVPLNEVQYAGRTALMIAVENDDAALVRTLLDAGADPNISMRRERRASPLTVAARSAIPGITRDLVSHGADVNHEEGTGYTPLMTAVFDGRAENAAYLLAHGADITVKSNHGDSVLTEAAGRGCPSVVETLLRWGSDPDARGGRTRPLVAAAQYPIVVKMLLQGGANPNLSDDGFTPLMAAAQVGSAGSVRALLTAGAKVNVRTRSGSTALMCAFTLRLGGDPDVTGLLLAAGAAVNVRDNDGMTALHYAARECCPTGVRRLLAAGARITFTHKGQLPSDLACPYYGEPEAVKGLFRRDLKRR